MGDRRAVWEASYDFARVPPGDIVDVLYKYQLVGQLQDQPGEPTAMRFPIPTATAELSMWLLMPAGREYQKFHLIRYPTG